MLERGPTLETQTMPDGKSHTDPTLRLSIPGVELGDLIGQGGFGTVYRARHLTLDVDVAVKIMGGGVDDGLTLDSALREARLMARLDHPNLLRIYDAGRSGDLIYLILELMDGGSCASFRHTSADRITELMRQLLSGLQALHDAQIIHRDIKPANFLLRNRDGRVKLADLGIAIEQATRSMSSYDLAGTIGFMAPELFESPPRFGVSSDLYALGMSVASMLMENDPFPHASLPEMITWVKSNDRPKLALQRTDVPTTITGLVDRLISPNVETRPESAAAALAWLSNSPPANIATYKTLSDTSDKVESIGPWILGERVYASKNWFSYVVTHTTSGVAARISLLQPGGGLARSNRLILESAERAAKLEHPGILEVVDWGVNAGFAYVVTAPRGRTVQDLIESRGASNELETVEFGMAIADSLDYLHRKGLVYQLVEPGAIVITPDALSVQLGWPLFCVPSGSPIHNQNGKSQRVLVERYAAPEATGFDYDTINPSVDMYGLGIVMYFMLVGDPNAVSQAVARAIAQGQGPSVRGDAPQITAPTTKLIASLMNPDPAARPKSAGQVRDELAGIRRRLLGYWKTGSDAKK
jgi:serine/threonine protein kinase